MMKRFRILTLFLLSSLVACSQPPVEKVADIKNSTGYATSAEALAALHANKNVTFTTANGWTVANDTANNTVWSFPPAGSPAYPSVVKRQFIKENGNFELKMTSNCEAPVAACQQLLNGFANMNAAMVNQLNSAR